MSSIFVELTSASTSWRAEPDRSDLGEVLLGLSGQWVSWPSIGIAEVAGDYQKYGPVPDWTVSLTVVVVAVSRLTGTHW
jgi:hypothetical protein